MAWSKVVVKIPDIKTAYKSSSGYDYSSEKVRKDNIRIVQGIKSGYGAIIKKYADAFGIPEGVVIGFIATESEGKMTPPNRFEATGLMQITPVAAFDGVTKFSRANNPIPPVALAHINARLPELTKAKELTSSLRAKMLNALSKEVELNILLGTLYLRWLLERFSSSGEGQLNKAMVAYNAGAYTPSLGGIKANTVPVDSTTLATNPKVPAESRAYLYKMLGKDGYLDLIYRQKVI